MRREPEGRQIVAQRVSAGKTASEETEPEGRHELWQPGEIRGHTLTKLVVHGVFSPKNRGHVFTPAIRKELYPLIGGVLKNIGCVPLAISGTDDHVHLCAEFPAKLSISELVGKVKSNSSRWLKSRFRVGKFEWQEGYGAFTVSHTKVETVRDYIAQQEEHHRKMTLKDELAWFCKNHGLPPREI